MFAITFDDKQLLKDITNIVSYTTGFMDGTKKGKTLLLNGLGARTVEAAKEFIDSYARVNPEILHHVYEWYQTGSPDARLFDISYTLVGDKIVIQNQFTQSQSIRSGSNVPFENKARIMENGQRLTIKPRNATKLMFDVNGEKVFTKNPVTVENPGGVATAGGFEKVFDIFFNKYFSQSFLKTSGILDYLSKPIAYKTNFRAGKNGGRTVGLSTGYKWAIAAGGKI